MSEKTYKLILKIGVLLSFVAFLIFSRDFYFPYITTKQIYFNILVEVLAVFWVAMILKFPHTRPKKSWITITMAVFFAVLLISCFTGVDFNLSFWGDLERMLGWFHIFHFFVFFLIVITVFKEWAEWKLLFNISIATAVIISLYGIFIGDPTSTIGQNAYVAGLMIFNFYFAILLFLKSEDLYEKIWLGVAELFILWGFVNSDVSGAQVGLLASLIVAGVLMFLLLKNRKTKLITISAVLVGLTVSVGLYMAKDLAVFDDTRVGKILRDLSLENNNLNTRLLSWESAVKDFPNHWLIGTGYGNYSIVFDKNFSPEFIKYASIEENFDRAHNNLIDIATTSGVLGLISYLSIFGVAVYYLVSGYKRKVIATEDFIVILALLTGYFVHNLAVFDALVNYVVLMCSLGYVYYLCTTEEKKKKVVVKIKNSTIIESVALIITGILMMFMIYNYNIKVISMMTYMIDGIIAWSQDNPEGAYEKYMLAINTNTPLVRDVRTSFVDTVSRDTSKLSALPADKQEEIFEYALELIEKNIKYNENDYFMNMEKSLVYLSAGEFYAMNGSDPSYYYDISLEAINTSIENAGARILPRIVKSTIYSSMGKYGEKVETFKEALEINPNYTKLYCYLAKSQLEANRFDQYEFVLDSVAQENVDNPYENLSKCLVYGETSDVSFLEYYDEISQYYEDNENWGDLLTITNLYFGQSQTNYEMWENLILAQWKTGDIDGARESISSVSALFPDRVGELNSTFGEIISF